MITKEKELKEKYEKFIQTKEGKAWINHWQKIVGSDTGRRLWRLFIRFLS